MAKTKRIKVRFHLGAGPHYKHWRIEYPNGDVQFISPEKCNMTLYNCQLHNRKGTAAGIHAGGEKVVCAWIWCTEIRTYVLRGTGTSVSYNPRVTPNWLVNGLNADNNQYDKIEVVGKNLYIN